MVFLQINCCMSVCQPVPRWEKDHKLCHTVTTHESGNLMQIAHNYKEEDRYIFRNCVHLVAILVCPCFSSVVLCSSWTFVSLIFPYPCSSMFVERDHINYRRSSTQTLLLLHNSVIIFLPTFDSARCSGKCGGVCKGRLCSTCLMDSST